MRLNHDADTYEEIVQYFKERAMQMALDNFELKQIKKVGHIVLAIFEKNGKDYHSIFVPKSKRGRGFYDTYMKRILPFMYEFKDTGINIVTSRDCNIESYLKKQGFKYATCLGLTDYDEYKTIDEVYGKDTANRSGVPFMNHIDEGLAILQWIGGSLSAKKAYCLHPIYQSDDWLKVYGVMNMRKRNIFGMHANVIVNAVEYRSVANEYLSTREIEGINEIRLSPLKDVNDMLIADKIQNRKDFELYHEGTHPRSKELAQYFRNWLQRLGVSEETYQEYKRKLIIENVG